MPRMATAEPSQSPPAEQHDVSNSFPPPARRAPQQPAAPEVSQATDERPLSEAEALAEIAAIAARTPTSPGPSRSILAAVIGLGVLLAAMLLLALIVSVGPDAGAISAAR